MQVQTNSNKVHYIQFHMNSLILHFSMLIMVISSSTALAQTCAIEPDQVVRLSTQQEVNDFQTTYGPCTILNASLTVAGEDISDLSPLSDLVEAKRFLSIQDNPELQSLEGLSNLEFVNNFWIHRNDKLTNLSGLSSLAVIHSELDIYKNNSLKTLEGINSLESINHFLTISSNPVLDNLNALADTEMPGTVFVKILANNELESLVGLPTVEQFERLEISSNQQLKSLHGIRVNNADLMGWLSIQNNPSLTSFEGMEWIESATRVTISRNHALLSFKGFSNLTNIGALRVSENESLLDFSGMEQLEYIGNFPASLTPAPFQGDFSVRSNPSLKNFKGLSSLRSIEGDLWIYNSIEMDSVNGLDRLIHIGDLSINLNPSILNLHGLAALRSAGAVGVIDNNKLGNCSALEPLLDVIDHANPGPGPGEHNAPDVAGHVIIENNAPGCNSLDQIAPKPDVAKIMTGSWYSPASSGEGFMMHVVKQHDTDPLENVMVGYFYGYDEEGERFWLIGLHEGHMTWQDPVEFSATITSGGSFEGFDPSAVNEIDWGSFSFTPGNCRTGSITMSGIFSGQSDNIEKTLEVIRLGDVAGDYCAQQTPAGITDSITGSWYDPAKSGQGFSIHKVNEQTGVVYFYGFDSNGTPLWLLGVWNSPLVAGEAVEFQMNQYNGGTFSEVIPDEIAEEPWGTMLLRMDSCGVAYAEMNGLDGKQIFFMQQLAGSLGLDCIE